jgi:hypothetical protein
VKPPPLLYMTTQRHSGDCGVAALAMCLGVSYEDALLALGGEVPTVLRRGVWMVELQRAADRLGMPMTLKRRCDLEMDDGVLQVMYRRGKDQHVVLLREGLVFDTDTSVWRPEDYAQATRARFGALLTRKD